QKPTWPTRTSRSSWCSRRSQRSRKSSRADPFDPTLAGGIIDRDGTAARRRRSAIRGALSGDVLSRRRLGSVAPSGARQELRRARGDRPALPQVQSGAAGSRGGSDPRHAGTRSGGRAVLQGGGGAGGVRSREAQGRAGASPRAEGSQRRQERARGDPRRRRRAGGG